MRTWTRGKFAHYIIALAMTDTSSYNSGTCMLKPKRNLQWHPLHGSVTFSIVAETLGQAFVEDSLKLKTVAFCASVTKFLWVLELQQAEYSFVLWWGIAYCIPKLEHCDVCVHVCTQVSN
jgi:hypothetical protein